MRNLIVLLFWLIAKPRREVLISAKNRLGEPIEHLRLSGDSGETFRIKGKDAYKPYNRVLGMVLSGFMDHFESLSLILQHYADMCEFGMDVTVLIDTFTPFSLSMIEYVRKKYFCHRIGEPIAMELFVFNSSARLALSGANRVHISENLDKYDLFIYQEDDIIVTLQHVQSILASRRRLEETLGVKGARIYGEGFWRYRRNLPKKNWESLYKFAGGPMSVPPRYNYSEDKGSLKVPDHRNTFYLEEKLDLHPVCIGNSSLSGSQKLPYYIAGSNIHQASFVLTGMLPRKLFVCPFFSTCIYSIVVTSPHLSIFDSPHKL